MTLAATIVWRDENERLGVGLVVAFFSYLGSPYLS